MHSEDENLEGYRGDIIELRVYRCEWFNMSDYWDITELMLTGRRNKTQKYSLCIVFTYVI